MSLQRLVSMRLRSAPSRLVVFTCALLLAGGARAAPITLQISSSGTTVPQAAPVGGDPITALELDLGMTAGDVADATGVGHPKSVVNRTIFSGKGAGGLGARAAARAKSNPDLALGFDGLDFFNQRFANGGNQFSVEPPDQALCVGNGYVLESVNDVLAIYDTAGTRLVGPVDLNTFYGYPAAINRSNGHDGPSITDPTCYFDPDTQRWFHVVLTLDRVGTSSALAGPNHLDIAVSQSADPTGAWNVYRLPAQNNGTQGTPNHGCAGGFCLGDYPHVGADANAFFITTNEFSLFADGFYGAQVYALSKRALAAGLPSHVVLFDLGDPSVPPPAFTVWPAQSPASQYDTSNGGTEWFLSSDAVFFDSGVSSTLWVWSVSSTSSIDTNPGALQLGWQAVAVQQYAVPVNATTPQKPGSTPLGECIADPVCVKLVVGPTASPTTNPLPGGVATNDSRMQQVVYANGKLWGALDTDVAQATGHYAGIAYFAVNPHSGGVVLNDTLSLDGASVQYPAVGVTPSGRGAIAFTVVGPNDYPSAGYASLDAKVGAGAVKIARAGAGPWDGFTGYLPFSDRPRWGDYGAAAVDGNAIWIASEYIAQTCTFAQYTAAPFGRCGGTRGSLGNWATRVSKLVP